MLRRISFFLQNYPPSFINKWFPYHQHNTHNGNRNQNILFCLKNISNHFFMRQLIYKNMFINLYEIDFKKNPIQEMAKFVERYCENLLLNGDCSENELYVDFSDKKNYLLREYKKITYENFNTNWFNYVLNEHKYYEKLNEYFLNIPYSYIWSTYFAEAMEDALVLDDDIEKDYPILKKFMTFNYEIDKERKYKIIFWDGKKYDKYHFSEIFNLLEQNGVCIATNTIFYVAHNTIGWFDIKDKITGFIKC